MRRLLAGVTALLAVGLSGTAGAEPSPTPPPPEAPLQVVVTQLLPRAPGVHSAVEVIGTVQNLGTRAVERITVRLKVGQPISFRGELHAADTDRPTTTTRRAATTEPSRTTLRPGESASFDLRTTVDQLQLRRDGVYPVDIEARGDTGDGIESLGLVPTWIPYYPRTSKPIRVAVVWPLVDQPRQDVDGDLLDDGLAKQLAPNGRLHTLLGAARSAETGECTRGATGPLGTHDPAGTRCEPVPISYAVDPDLVSAIGAMSQPYKVGKTEGSGTSAAKSWLTNLQAAVAAGSLLALPYADPDVSALSRTSGGQEDLALATVLARTTLTQALGASPVDGVAWPPPGPVSQAGADALARNGIRQLVLDESAYGQPDSEPTATPSTRSVFTTSATGTTVDGLVTDAYLSDLVTGPDVPSLGARLAEQRFLAETAVIAAELPGRLRTLLIAPSRHTDADLTATVGALRDLGRVPWLCPVSLASVANATEHCAQRTSDRSTEPEPRGDPRTDTAGQLSTDYLDRVYRDRKVLDQVTSAILSDSQDTAIRDRVARTKERLRKAVARAESSAWRASAEGGRESLGLLDAEVDRLRSKVVVRAARTALLTSSKGTLQVSIENTLDVPVDVRVSFTSKTATLSRALTRLIEVPPGNAVQAEVKAEAQRSGKFVVFAQLQDRNGQPFGPEEPISVTSTRYGRLALAVTAGGAGVLLVAAGYRIFRRAVASR